jgi:hypothetical protein
VFLKKFLSHIPGTSSPSHSWNVLLFGLPVSLLPRCVFVDSPRLHLPFFNFHARKFSAQCVLLSCLTRGNTTPRLLFGTFIHLQTLHIALHTLMTRDHTPRNCEPITRPWITGQLDNASLAHAHLMRRRILFSDQPVVRLGRLPLPYLTVSFPRLLWGAEARTLMAGTMSIK